MPSDDRHRADRRVLPFPTRRPVAVTGDHRAMHDRYPNPIHVGAQDAELPIPFPPRRSTGSASTASFKEHATMNSLHVSPGMHVAHAEFRRQEMLAEAERARRLALVAPVARRRAVGVAAMRRQVGAALVNAGHRLQGVGAGAAAAEPADALPAVGTLRVVR